MFNYPQMRTKSNWGNQISQCCKLPCLSPGSTWFQAQGTPKLALLRQEESCWKKGWLFHEGEKKGKHLDRMPSLLRTPFLQAGRLDVPTHPGCRQRNTIREDGQKEKAAKSMEWFMPGPEGGWSPALQTEARMSETGHDGSLPVLMSPPDSLLLDIPHLKIHQTIHLWVSMVEKRQNTPSPSVFP